MLSLKEISQLFPGENPRTIKEFYLDNELRRIIVEQIGDKIIKSKGIIQLNGYESIRALFSKANFAYSSEECVYVAKIVNRYIDKKDFIPRVSEQRGEDLGSRCLVSLSMFPKTMEQRAKRYGAPKPEFYREAGIIALEEKRRDVSSNFRKWENFIPEMLGSTA